MRLDTEPLVTDLTPPGVVVHCLYGSGIPTSEAFQYSDKFPDVEPTVVYGDGDGTVNLQSAMQCGRWVGKQKQPVMLKELPGNEHVNMLLNITTVAYIKTVLFSPWCWQEVRDWLAGIWLSSHTHSYTVIFKLTEIQSYEGLSLCWLLKCSPVLLLKVKCWHFVVQLQNQSFQTNFIAVITPFMLMSSCLLLSKPQYKDFYIGLSF